MKLRTWAREYAVISFLLAVIVGIAVPTLFGVNKEGFSLTSTAVLVGTLTCLTTGFLGGFPLWLVYKFLRFIAPQRHEMPPQNSRRVNLWRDDRG